MYNYYYSTEELKQAVDISITGLLPNILNGLQKQLDEHKHTSALTKKTLDLQIEELYTDTENLRKRLIQMSDDKSRLDWLYRRLKFAAEKDNRSVMLFKELFDEMSAVGEESTLLGKEIIKVKLAIEEQECMLQSLQHRRQTVDDFVSEYIERHIALFKLVAGDNT